MRKIIFGLPATFFLMVAALWSWQAATFVALPLDVPINLSQRGQKTFTFMARENGRHFVQINLRSNTFANLKLPHIRVFQDQNEVKYGSYTGSSSSETISEVLREVVATKGATYNVVVDIKQPDKKIQTTKPDRKSVV